MLVQIIPSKSQSSVQKTGGPALRPSSLIMTSLPPQASCFPHPSAAFGGTWISVGKERIEERGNTFLWGVSVEGFLVFDHKLPKINLFQEME